MDFERFWRRNGWRRNLMIRTWNYFSWRLFRRFITGGRLYAAEDLELSIRSLRRSNCYCYCPSGTVTDFRAAFLGIGVWISYSRDRVKEPCVCDQVMAELFPEELDCSRQKHLHVQNKRGMGRKEAPEVLLINGPAFEGTTKKTKPMAAELFA